MPTKRRTTKVRNNLAEEVGDWAAYFNSGRDFWGCLPEIGIPTDEEGRPDRAVAEATWHRLGAWFLAHHRPRRRDPWALEEFGDPDAT